MVYALENSIEYMHDIYIINILITEWALDAYLDIEPQYIFTPQEYRRVIRPDIQLLKSHPYNLKFRIHKFWPPAQDPKSTNGILRDGFKMKWHNIGNGNLQLRLPVGIVGDANLCGAYIKINAKQERRLLAKFKTHLQWIRDKQYIPRGKLS